MSQPSERVPKLNPKAEAVGMALIIGDYELQDGECAVFNRNGHSLLNSEGFILSHYIDDGVEDFAGHFRYITRVDLNEWRKYWKREPQDELDLSDVAYWYKLPDSADEIYCPAIQKWRDDEGEFIRNLLKGPMP